MTESLFLMERYWGSDESDVDDSEAATKPKSKRRKIRSSVSPSFENGVSDNQSGEDIYNKAKVNHSTNSENCVNETLSGSKKKRKKIKLSEVKDTTTYKIANNQNEDSTAVKSHHSMEESSEMSSEKNVSAKSEKPLKRKRKRDQIDDANDKMESPENEDNEDNNDVESNTLVKEEKDLEKSDEGLFPVMRDMMSKGHEKVERILPDWLAKPSIIQIDSDNKGKKIEDIDFLDNNTKQNLQKSKIQFLFPVQAEVIPWLLRSTLTRSMIPPSDLCVSAPTGSGKTLAFVIPIVQSLKSRVVTAIRALVVLPVGDLATQVFRVFQSFCKGTDLQVILAVGQKSFSQEQSLLVKKTSRGYLSNIDIVVCTPGRLIDHIDRTPGFSLQKLQYLVIDEADRMMDEIQSGWLKKVENAVKEKCSPSDCPCFSSSSLYQRSFSNSVMACTFGNQSEPPLQKLLFSATLSQNPEKLHDLSLYRPKLFTIVRPSSNEPQNSGNRSKFQDDVIEHYVTPDTLTEYFITCESSIKPLAICHLLKTNPYKKVLCFTQSIEHSHRLYIVLNNILESGVRELSSSLKAVQRKIILEQFEAGKIHVLVCSDIMARGMDIENVDCVISYDMPFYIKTYIHRIGRTARAGKTGVAITLLEQNDLSKFKSMLNTAGKSLPCRLYVQNSDLEPLEESFKNALSLSSDIIAKEKQNKNKMRTKSRFFKKKMGVSSPKRNNNSKLRNNL